MPRRQESSSDSDSDSAGDIGRERHWGSVLGRSKKRRCDLRWQDSAWARYLPKELTGGVADDPVRDPSTPDATLFHGAEVQNVPTRH